MVGACVWRWFHGVNKPSSIDPPKVRHSAGKREEEREREIKRVSE